MSNPEVVNSQILSTEIAPPGLEDILVQNQTQWRARSKGWRTLSSPVEINPTAWFLGVGVHENIIGAFGTYMHPAHREYPPLIGVSIFSDLPETEVGAAYWESVSPYLNDTTTDFNEAKVRWLANVAAGKNPLSLSPVEEYSMSKSIRQAYVGFIRACEQGLSSDVLTDSLATHHFRGDNRQLDEIFPQLIPAEKPQTFTEYMVQRKQEFKRDNGAHETHHEMLKRETRARLPMIKSLRQLMMSVARIHRLGSMHFPGIVNLEMKTDLLFIGGTIYFASQGTAGNAGLLLSLPVAVATEAYIVFEKRNAVIHEVIHATGITETHNQGFPAAWKKEDIK